MFVKEGEMTAIAMDVRLSTRPTPALLYLTRMLTLSTTSLQELIQQELAENPAIEEQGSSGGYCDRCGTRTFDWHCAGCMPHRSSSLPYGGALREQNADPILQIATQRSTADMLLADLYASLAARDHPIALALVGALDDRGFLADDPSAIAERLRVAPERVSQILRLLQELGPPGIGSCTISECLLAQIAALEAEGVVCPSATPLVIEHLEALGNR